MFYMLAKECQQQPRGRTTGPRPPLHCAQNRITPASRESARRIHTAEGRNRPLPPEITRGSWPLRKATGTPALTRPSTRAPPRPHTSHACPLPLPRSHKVDCVSDGSTHTPAGLSSAQAGEALLQHLASHRLLRPVAVKTPTRTMTTLSPKLGRAEEGLQSRSLLVIIDAIAVVGVGEDLLEALCLPLPAPVRAPRPVFWIDVVLGR